MKKVTQKRRKKIDLLQRLFRGKTPEEVKQILDFLDEEHIQKLAVITSAVNTNQLSVTKLTNVKETIDLINTIFKAGVEAAKNQDLRKIESRIISPIEYLNQIRQTAEALGLTPREYLNRCEGCPLYRRNGCISNKCIRREIKNEYKGS